MNARKITVISTRDQKQSVIMSTAETLGELKADLQEAGINYEGLTFHERLSKVELVENNSILPHDVPYRGTVTNELVFLLTNTGTKIKSGYISRIEAYAFIKEHHLQDECMAAYGRNFTTCTTQELEDIINNYNTCKAREHEAQHTCCVETSTPGMIDNGARDAIRELVEALWDENVIDLASKDEVLNCIDDANTTPRTVPQGPASYKKEGSSSYSDEELKALIGDLDNY